jgi:hypothetical protein
VVERSPVPDFSITHDGEAACFCVPGLLDFVVDRGGGLHSESHPLISAQELKCCVDRVRRNLGATGVERAIEDSTTWGTSARTFTDPVWFF